MAYPSEEGNDKDDATHHGLLRMRFRRNVKGLFADSSLLYLKMNQIVESMFVKVKRGETLQTFNLWVYGDTFLARGSGINVGSDGLVCNHHFLTPKDGTAYAFLSGGYTIEVYVSLVGRRSPLLLSTISLSLSDEHATAMRNMDVGIFFDWGPDSQNYHAHIDERPNEKIAQTI